MGFSHGRQLRDRIHLTAQEMRQEVGAEIYEVAWKLLQPSLSYSIEHAPYLVEEMEGIAAGAEIDFSHVYRINAHLDLAVWKHRTLGLQGEEPIPGCSSHAVKTSTGVILGWNGDDSRRWLDCGAVIRGAPAVGAPFVYWSLAGSVGRPGVTPHLALGANSIGSASWRSDGVLYPMMARLLLGCNSTPDAIRTVDRYASCSPMNYLLADADGNVVNIEVEPYRFAELRPKDQGTEGYFLHTNSLLDTVLAGQEVDPDTICPRLSAARRLYRESLPTNPASVWAVLSDHTGGICVHGEESQTVVSFVAEVRAGRVHVVKGNPCSGQVRTYAVSRDR